MLTHCLSLLSCFGLGGGGLEGVNAVEGLLHKVLVLIPTCIFLLWPTYVGLRTRLLRTTTLD